MKSRKQILREYAKDPAKLAAYTLEIQEQLQQTRKALAQKEREYQEQLQQTHEQLSLKEEQLTLKEQELAQAQALIAELKQELFGPKADKLDAEQEEQLSQLFQDAQEQAQRPEPLSREVLQDALKNERNEESQERQERKRRRRRNLPPVKLEEQTQVLEPPDKICPHTGVARKQIGQEVTTEYDLVAAKLIVRKIIRPKYAPCEQSCCSGVAIAPLPPRLIDQSKLGLGLAVHILLSRFDDHVAYYTLERNFNERFGAIIPRQQMVQWVEKIAHLLLAVYNLIWELMRAGPYLQMDETPVKVLDPEVKGKAGQGYLWFYSVPGGDVFLEFNGSRGHQTPLKRLKGFQGTIQADGYVAYKTLVGKMPGLRRIGCASHARRKFHKALKESVSDALWFIGRIRQLYKIERLASEVSPEQRLLMRRRQAAPIWKEMKRKADELIAAQTHLPKSSMGKALSFFRNEYTALVGYLRHPEFQIDNNLVENDVRPSAVGRRRWLFIGHPDAGWRSAVIYTIIQCCRRRGINPQEYLTDALQRLPSMTTSQVHELLPSNWKPKKSTHASVEIPQ